MDIIRRIPRLAMAAAASAMLSFAAWGEETAAGAADGNDKEERLQGPAFWGSGSDIAKAMSKLKEEDPEKYAELDELRRNDMEKFLSEIKGLLPKPKNSRRLMYLLEADCRELASEIRNCKDEAEKEKLEALLKARIKEGFDFMMDDSLERLERMRLQIEAMKKNEAKILEMRYKEFIDPTFRRDLFLDGFRDKRQPRPPFDEAGPRQGGDELNKPRRPMAPPNFRKPAKKDEEPME